MSDKEYVVNGVLDWADKDKGIAHACPANNKSDVLLSVDLVKVIYTHPERGKITVTPKASEINIINKDNIKGFGLKRDVNLTSSDDKTAITDKYIDIAIQVNQTNGVIDGQVELHCEHADIIQTVTQVPVDEENPEMGTEEETVESRDVTVSDVIDTDVSFSFELACHYLTA